MDMEKFAPILDFHLIATGGENMLQNPKIHLEQVSMKYLTKTGETSAISQMTFQVAPGEFIVMVGPSGCGKSTVLSLIAGLLKPTQGKVSIDGEEVTGTSSRVGYMLQQDYLFEWRTILDNAILGLELQPKPRGIPSWTIKKQRREKVMALLQKYGLSEFACHYPHQLSGGMRQRVALIRTLAIDPDILLLDEPFSALDYQTKLTLEQEVAVILRREKKTVVLVTHDISEAVAMADRVMVLSNRPATIKAIFPINLMCEEKTPFSAREAPEFRYYFKKIWEELDVHV